MFYPVNNKAGIEYTGSKDLVSMDTWLKENSPCLNNDDKCTKCIPLKSKEKET